MSTQDNSYTDRLVTLSDSRFRKLLNVQAPYAWNIRRTVKGFTLDIGCGIGRNLAHLRGQAIGIDHNQTSVDVCRKNGFIAYTPDEFAASEHAELTYETLLLSHVLEHMTVTQAHELLESYLPHLSEDGRVVIICPQQRGFKSDSTHVHFFDSSSLTDLVHELGMHVSENRSFPLPGWCGRWFTHNETIVIAERIS